jgi:hypothetical protein
VRRFLVAPDVAEWASIKLRTGALPHGPHSVIVHAVPSARGDVPNAKLQLKRMLALREFSEETLSMPVKGGATLEIAMQVTPTTPQPHLHPNPRSLAHSCALPPRTRRYHKERRAPRTRARAHDAITIRSAHTLVSRS